VGRDARDSVNDKKYVWAWLVIVQVTI